MGNLLCAGLFLRFRSIPLLPPGKCSNIAVGRKLSTREASDPSDQKGHQHLHGVSFLLAHVPVRGPLDDAKVRDLEIRPGLFRDSENSINRPDFAVTTTRTSGSRDAADLIGWRPCASPSPAQA